MERLDEGAQEAAQILRTQYPHAVEASATFALAVRQSGVLHAWTDLMGAANHAPNPDRRRACAELRDGLTPWWSTQDGDAPTEPKAILTWLINKQSPEQLALLRARLLPLLEHLHTPAAP